MGWVSVVMGWVLLLGVCRRLSGLFVTWVTTVW